MANAGAGTFLSLSNITRTYQLGKVDIHALRGVSLDIPADTFVSIIGASGCGKTTLMNLIGCIDVPDSGTIFMDGRDILAMNDKELTSYRGESIGFIFQNFNLIPVLTVEENIAYPLFLSKKKLAKAEIRERVAFIMDAIGLSAHASHKPNELSGGQRQRVAIGRALVIHPTLVIADEPTANLDSQTSRSVMKLMRTLQETLHTTFVFSTHDFRFIDYVDTIYEMKDGIIVGERKKDTIKTIYEVQH